MGVLDPLERNASAMQEIKDDYHGMLDMTLENLESFGGAILNDRHDIMDENDPFFFLIWRDDDVMDINSMEELQEEIRTVNMLKQDVSLEALRNKYSKVFAGDRDVEPDYDNPIQSYEELDSLFNDLESLDGTISEKVVEKTGVDPELMERDVDIVEYMLLETFYTLSDTIDALPLIEGIVESQENIEREMENLLAKAVDEHREYRESVDPGYDRLEIPTEPVDWDSVIEEENLREFMDISEIPNVTYGDTLHMMMEQVCEDIEGVEPEYPLHFRNPGNRGDTMNGNRIDNTLRPDAVDDLFVYEFKHMPLEQRQYMEENGDLERNDKFVENVEQINGYLNELDLPAGMLVYVSSDMDVKEYVVEKHPENGWSPGEDDYSESFVHEKEDYEFEEVASEL